MSNILEYLTKNEVLSFKATSRRIALLCLQQMEKYKVRTFNMNEMIDIKLSRYYTNYCQIYDELKTIRYNGCRTISCLKQAWSKNCQIQKENLLLYPIECNPNSHDPFLCLFKDSKFLSSHFDNDSISHHLDDEAFLLFDKLNMVKIDENGKVFAMDSSDQMGEEMDLVILSYHNIQNDKIFPIQYLIIHKHVTYGQIGAYINDAFIVRNERQKEFAESFKGRLYASDTNKRRRLKYWHCSHPDPRGSPPGLYDKFMSFMSLWTQKRQAQTVCNDNLKKLHFITISS